MTTSDLFLSTRLHHHRRRRTSKTANMTDHSIPRKEAEDAIAYAQVRMKDRYDKKHKTWTPAPGEEVYLRLRNYSIPGVPNKKLSERRIGPFVVKRNVGRLAHELDLPHNFRIHPVISVAELEPAAMGTDPYLRPKRRTHRQVVAGDPPDVERILEEKTRKYGRKQTPVVLYRTRFAECGPEHDRWLQERYLPKTILQTWKRRKRNAGTAK